MNSSKLKGLSFHVVDSLTGHGLDGATFVLLQNNKVIRSSTSKLGGYVCFKVVFPGYYILKESTMPFGYEVNNKTYNVYIDNDYFTIDGNNYNFVVKNKKQLL